MPPIPAIACLAAGRGGLACAITGFSAANYYLAAANGGEYGVATGFGQHSILRFTALPTASTIWWQCYSGWDLRTEVNALRATAYNGANARVSGPAYTVTTSDLGRMRVVTWWLDPAGFLRMMVDTIELPPVAITGYTPYDGANRPALGAVNGGTSPFTSGSWSAQATFRGAPMSAQMREYQLAARALGDLPSTMSGATITHRQSLKEQLRALGGAVTSGQTAPATLEDTITRAAADALARQGAPTVVTIDTSRDGRRKLGVLGMGPSNGLESAAGKGIAGSPSGFHVAFPFAAYAGSAANRYLVLSSPSPGGWSSDVNAAGTNLRVALYAGTSPTIINVALSATDLGRERFCEISYNGTAVHIYLDGQLVSTTAFSGYTVAASPFKIGSAPSDGVTVWGAVGGNTAHSLAQAQDAYAQWVATGKIPQTAGAEHLYDLTLDMLAAGETVPAQVLDRIGTDHLTRKGVGVASGAVRVQTGQADFFRSAPGGGFRGSAGGFVVYWMGAIEDLVMAGAAIFAEVVSGSNAGWSLQSGNNDYSQIRLAYFDASGTFRTSSLVDLKTIVSAGQIVILHGVWTGSYLQIYVQGTQRGADVGPYTGYAAPASTEPMYIGSRTGSNLTPQNCRHAGFGAAAGVPSAAQIAAHAAACLAAGKVVAFTGYDDRRFDLVQDVIDAGGGLPVFTVDRAGSGEKLPRVGAPLQVAQRTERQWSYETSPIYYGASAFTDTDRFVFDGGFPGDAASWWGLLWYIVTSQSVPSATRGLLSCNTAASGWDVRTSLTNTTVSMGFADGAGSYTTVGTSAIAAADVGKIQAFGFGWNAPAGQPQTFAKRAAIGPASRTGYTPGAGAPLVLGGFSTPGNPASAGISLLGFALGFGAPATAEWQAAFDSGLSLERVVGIAGRTATLVDLTRDAKARGGLFPLTLQDYAGAGRTLLREGSPTITAHHARAFGW